MTEEERRNLDAVQNWVELHNTDSVRFVTECYTEDCEVVDMGYAVIRGHDPFVAIEQGKSNVQPNRRIRLDRTIARDDAVVVQATMLDPDRRDWETPFCTVLFFREGLIFKEEAYVDNSVWPLPALSPEFLEEHQIELIKEPTRAEGHPVG